jgi:hypothetical protein
MDGQDHTPEPQTPPEAGNGAPGPDAWETSVERALNLVARQVDALTNDVRRMQHEVLKLGGKVNTLFKERRK